MSQVSIYLVPDLLKKVSKKAKKEGKSISQYCRDAIEKQLTNDDLPADFFELFGKAADETFTRPHQSESKHDSKREELK